MIHVMMTHVMKTHVMEAFEEADALIDSHTAVARR